MLAVSLTIVDISCFAHFLEHSKYLCIDVGSFSDPDDIPGFTHFLERSTEESEVCKRSLKQKKMSD